MNRRNTCIWIGPILIGALFASLASAAEIKGKASDSVGGALQGAQITLDNLATGSLSVLMADASGAYSFTGLAAGMYRVIAHANGSSEGSRNITLVGLRVRSM